MNGFNGFLFLGPLRLVATPDRQRAVRTEQWKLIRTPKENQVRLFNVRRDPWKKRNLPLIQSTPEPWR